MRPKFHLYKDGQPCGLGCDSHVSHPCENCGRIRADMGQTVIYWRNKYISSAAEFDKYKKKLAQVLDELDTGISVNIDTLEYEY